MAGAALAAQGGHKSTAATQASEWLLIRHAPVETGRLAGRADLPATLPAAPMLERIRAETGRFDRLLASPAQRCTATARALFPQASVAIDERLMEQDFGHWDDLPYADIPDLGPIPATELSRHAPPGGESFEQACARIAPALLAAGPGRTVFVAHAGTVRAALALVLGSPALALGFEVAPLSSTLVRALPGGQFAVAYVNRLAAQV